MQFDKALIYEAKGADPSVDLVVRESTSGRLTIVPVGDPDQIIPVSQDLAGAGVALIELCGGLSPIWRERVVAAVDEGLRVSSVTFGIESIGGAAAYNAAFLNGRPPPEGFLFLEDGADPRVDRFIKSYPPQRTTFVAVPNAEAGADVAAEMAAAGFGLIELYGGFSLEGAAAVISAVDGRTPVGVGSFTFEQTLRRSDRVA